MKGKAEVTVTVTLEGDEMYGNKLATAVENRLEESFDEIERLDIYTL